MVPNEVIMNKIYLIRGKKVMLDRDLAVLYEVETKRLKEQVRRNKDRFPEDFMFELTKEELFEWRQQFGTSNKEIMGLRIPPFAFSEHGIVMLASVLNSERAIQVNIQIVRVFTKMRELILTHKDLLLKMDQLDSRVASQDQKIALIFKYLKKFIDVHDKPRKEVGFKRKEEQ